MFTKSSQSHVLVNTVHERIREHCLRTCSRSFWRSPNNVQFHNSIGSDCTHSQDSASRSNIQGVDGYLRDIHIVAYLETIESRRDIPAPYSLKAYRLAMLRADCPLIGQGHSITQYLRPMSNQQEHGGIAGHIASTGAPSNIALICAT